jgi:hypothetical protein
MVVLRSALGTARALAARRLAWALALVERAGPSWARHESLAYLAFATAATAYAAAIWHGSMLAQTGGVWSAPLDDVFIHFDFARALARGHPFHWSEGNGYSSGGTSLTYPVVLAVGWLLGFRELALLRWAALVACASIVLFLWASARALDAAPARAPGRALLPAPRWVKFLLPPAVLSLGCLGWTLFSGMETALFLAIWGGALGAALAVARAATDARPGVVGGAVRLGLLGALLVATRPEAGVCVAALAVFAALHVRGRRAGAVLLTVTALPAVALLGAQAFANRVLTGHWSASGAVTKLIVSDPYRGLEQVWALYREHTAYVVERFTEHHFTDAPPWGWLLPAAALLPLAARATRPLALLLWAQIAGWLAIVCLNHELAAQNQRYAMPAVAWLALLAAVGIGVLASAVRDGARGTLAAPLRASWLARGALAAALVVVYWRHQEPRLRSQLWFFARSARNIAEQQLHVGRLVGELRPHRVLVGDAGAITYLGDRPGLDLLGLGGFRALPFARATAHGLGAGIELLERVPEHDRPDLMAIYPSWWGSLSIHFGRYLTSVAARGNVICGSVLKDLYETDWSPLDASGRPATLGVDERIVDELDVADLVSEAEHDTRLTVGGTGRVSYRVLSDPAHPRRDRFDAGRSLPAAAGLRARLRAPGSAGGRLLLRLAPVRPVHLDVLVDGAHAATLFAAPVPRVWQELGLELPPLAREHFVVELAPRDAPSIQYHLWVLERVRPAARPPGEARTE